MLYSGGGKKESVVSEIVTRKLMNESLFTALKKGLSGGLSAEVGPYFEISRVFEINCLIVSTITAASASMPNVCKRQHQADALTNIRCFCSQPKKSR